MLAPLALYEDSDVNTVQVVVGSESQRTQYPHTFQTFHARQIRLLNPLTPSTSTNEAHLIPFLKIPCYRDAKKIDKTNAGLVPILDLSFGHIFLLYEKDPCNFHSQVRSVCTYASNSIN